MYKWTKRFVILAAISVLVYTGIYAVGFTNSEGVESSLENFDFIEEMKLDSSRYSQVDDLSTVDLEEYIEITDDDELITSNSNFELYFNEEFISFKVKNKHTNYVWSTSIDSPQAGTFTPLLESGVGIEYINVTKNMAVTENIGVSDTVFILETEEITDGLLLKINIGGFCSKRTCERFYPDYLEGKYTKEEMVEYGLTEINISFDLNVTLNEEGLRANVPVDSISENNSEEILLSSIIIFPSLGATHMDDIPGYMILPEGSGTLIRYEDNQGKFITPFIERYYGLNYGLNDSRSSVLSYPLSMPIFGAVHGVNQNAMLGIIEEGDFNARLYAFPNGALNIDYNLIFAKVDYRQVYRQPFTSDGSQGTDRQLQTVYTDTTIQYNFLDDEDANYVGVGGSYREYLQDNEVLNQKVKEDSIPIKVEFFMSDAEQTFFGSQIVKASTVSEVETMYNYLLDKDVTNQHVLLTGWNDGGASGNYPIDIDFENKLGSNKEFRNLIELINEQNQVTLSNNFVISSESSDNIRYRQDVALGVNRLKLVGECDDCVTGDRYILYPDTTKSLALSYYQDFVDENVNILFSTLGNTLTSYYDSGYYLREDTYQIYQEVMEQYIGTGEYSYPNSYAYQYTDSFYYAPMYNSQLKYYDDLIPLVQIVLHGSMDMFSDDLNFNSLGQEQILSLIDFGVSPSFILTEQTSSMLKDTDSSYLYTTEFDLWKDTVASTYSYVNDALKHVDSEYIVGRTVLERGIVKVSYSNDVDIYINYTSDEYVGAVTIPAMDYYVGGGE